MLCRWSQCHGCESHRIYVHQHGLVSYAFKPMGCELEKKSSGTPLDMAAVRTIVEEIDGVNMEDRAEQLLLRVMLLCSLHVLLSATVVKFLHK